MFLLLMIAQCLLLASFPAKYQENSTWYAFVAFIVPALGVSWWWITSHEEKIHQLLYVWFSYIFFGLVPMVGIVFALTEDKLDRNQEFGPNVLKICLNFTPLLLLLLLNTAAVPRYRKLLTGLSFMMTIDIFDGNDLLRMVIDENIENTAGHKFGIPKSFMRAVLSFALITFLLSPYEMMAKLLVERQDGKKCFQCLNAVNGLIQVVQNLVVLGLRLAVFLGYKWDASMFMAKNVIMIIFRTLECVYVFCDGGSDGRGQREEAEHPLNARPPPTAPPAACVDKA